jgi:hypothetical protein
MNYLKDIFYSRQRFFVSCVIGSLCSSTVFNRFWEEWNEEEAKKMEGVLRGRKESGGNMENEEE